VAGADLARPSSKAEAEGRTILFVDEAAFYLLPFVGRTYAPRGHTPVLRVPLTRDHLSAISAITANGRLFTHIQREPFRGPAIVAFLRQLLRQVCGKLLVIWDGAPIHHGQAVKHFLAGGAAHRLHLERLPGYAPELNADEGVWNLLKRTELKNRCCQDLDELRWELGLAIRRVRRKAHVLAACFRQCGYLEEAAQRSGMPHRPRYRRLPTTTR
jgi:transposase